MLSSLLLFGFKGDGLSMDVLETLVRVAPTADEKKKFMLFDGSLQSLGPPDRFFHAILHVPNAFARLSAMLYRSQYEEEMRHVQGAIKVLDVSTNFELLDLGHLMHGFYLQYSCYFNIMLQLEVEIVLCSYET